MRKVLFSGILLIFLFTAQMVWACPLKVFVSIVPQKYFVEKIGGDLVDVSVMVQPGANPHNYEPKPKQMVALSKTRIYFAIGITFEEVWLERISATNSRMRIVHTEAGIEKIPMLAHHHHEEESEHRLDEDIDHGIEDPHIWLSPPLVMVQARNILQAVVSVDPLNRSRYEKNYRDFIMELVVLDAKLIFCPLPAVHTRFGVCPILQPLTVRP